MHLLQAITSPSAAFAAVSCCKNSAPKKSDVRCRPLLISAMGEADFFFHLAAHFQGQLNGDETRLAGSGAGSLSCLASSLYLN